MKAFKNKYLGYDIKQSYGKAFMKVALWGMRGKKELNCVLMINQIV